MLMTGLHVNVLRDANGHDCTLNGVTSRYTDFVLVGEGVQEVQNGETEDEAVLILVRRNVPDHNGMPYLTAYPVGKDGNAMTHGMFGGNYINTSDSRFPCAYPIPVHDRFEV